MRLLCLFLAFYCFINIIQIKPFIHKKDNKQMIHSYYNPLTNRNALVKMDAGDCDRKIIIDSIKFMKLKHLKLNSDTIL